MYHINSFPTSGNFCRPLISFSNSLDKTLGLIWIQTVWHSDGISFVFFEKVNFKKNPQITKKHAKLPNMQRDKLKWSKSTWLFFSAIFYKEDNFGNYYLLSAGWVPVPHGEQIPSFLRRPLLRRKAKTLLFPQKVYPLPLSSLTYISKQTMCSLKRAVWSRSTTFLSTFYTPPHVSCGVLWYHVGCLCVCLSVQLYFISGR